MQLATEAGFLGPGLIVVTFILISTRYYVIKEPFRIVAGDHCGDLLTFT